MGTGNIPRRYRERAHRETDAHVRRRRSSCHEEDADAEAWESWNVRSPDRDSARWIAQLHGDRRDRDDAVRRLHKLLLKMAYARLSTPHKRLREEAFDEVAVEAANAALVAVLAHLDDFRGASRFTTWACQFAITEVSVAMRRRRRYERELPVEPEAIVLLTAARPSVERELEQAELLRLICAAVNETLSARQREVLLALAVRGDSPEVLAAELGTNTGALYKSLHDARRKLRARLAAEGLSAA